MRSLNQELKPYLVTLAKSTTLNKRQVHEEIFETLVLGSLGNYLSMSEYDDLMEQVMASYGNNVIFRKEIG